MNPNTVIKPWLEAVGKLYGNAKAYDYRKQDPDTGPQQQYFEYKILSMEPPDDLPERQNTRTGNTLNRRIVSQWKTTVQIDLHRSQNGMAELAKCVAMAEDDNPDIKKIFDKDSCAFLDCLIIENMTDSENENSDSELREKYHHRMLVRFYDKIIVSSDEENQVVNKVNISLGLI